MQEVIPGVLEWSTYHEGIRQQVSSHYVDPLGGGGPTLIDPMVPDEGIEAIAARGAPARIVLTNRHHYRHSEALVREFGCPVLCPRAGLHEFEGGPEVEPFDFGDEPAPGITALEVAAISPDDTALHVAAGDGALAFADGLIHYGEVGFVPDFLIGDDPEPVKREMTAALRRLLELDLPFDSLLFAHGASLIGGGRRALAEFVEGQG
jgi:hypothetical protein